MRRSIPMLRPRNLRTPEPRRGIILLVVLAMLTLFATVGITFVFYADAEAVASRGARDAGTQSVADVDPEIALALFLSQFIFDVDDTNGVSSAMRGHSLLRTMFGMNYTLNANGTYNFL